jgi:hypothetical protein
MIFPHGSTKKSAQTLFVVRVMESWLASLGHMLGQQLSHAGNERRKGRLGRLGHLQGFGPKPKKGKKSFSFYKYFYTFKTL